MDPLALAGPERLSMSRNTPSRAPPCGPGYES